MALSPAMNLNIPTDQIIGFEDFGKDVNSNQTENIADHVLVLMIKGIKMHYKQPIFYGFCKSATKAVILKNIIKNVIKKIFEAGLTVVATVCDQSTINSKVVHEMCNKLTEAHVLPEKIPKMKVKHAAQVFSQRVSGALRFCARKHLLPQECTDTADLLLLFDQLFDSFNGGSYKITHKIYKTCVKNNSEHFTLWNKILPVLCSMAFKTEAKKRDGTMTVSYEKVPSIKNWIHNIRTVKDFWQYLTKEYNITSLLMRNLNQEYPVENFFSSVRSHGVRNINPTCLQFENIYKTLLVNNLCSNHSLGANCEEDTNKMLHNLDVLLMNNPPEPPRNNDDDKIEEICSNDILAGGSDNELVSETKKYVAGYVIKKTKTLICKSCNTCNLDLYDTTPPKVDNYILSIDITRKSLQYPSQNFTICVNNIIKIIKHFLKNCPHKSGIIRKIKILVRNIVQFDFLSCDIHKEKIEIFVTNFLIKCIIYSWCNNVNRILKGKHVRHVDDKVKIQALKYYKTHTKHKSNQ
ncbi:hypothetical protein HW555_014002 [Spodoptera exigua]|uniref:Transposable element P transposase n=1 Tax=Spodoptera exigua TaxID=7107 RepID=A0A835G0K1_SPOEX|nr:hypothetical protein HW555_014002 [Spodoptera exigua]